MRVPREWREDVVHTAWLKYLRRRPVFAGEDVAEQKRRWLNKAAHDEAANIFRYLQRHPAESLNDRPEEPTDWRNETVEESKLARQCELVGEWMKELASTNPLNYRLMSGRYEEGLSIEKLAAREGLDHRGVTIRLHRVRVLWRKRAACLRDEEADL